VIAQVDSYPSRLDIDYPEKLDRFTTFFRLIWAIPIMIILAAPSSTASSTVIVVAKTGETVPEVARTGGGIAAGLWFATVLMIGFRERYPRWWFDFAREFTRFEARIGAYLALLTDRHPSTVDERDVHLDIDYPEVEQDLNRWLPLVKLFLAIPHFIVLAVLAIVAFFAVIIAWFSVLFTGPYPRELFDYSVGVTRWGLRVVAYAVLLVTDRYPPFQPEVD
jgi:hypothetical protein